MKSNTARKEWKKQLKWSAILCWVFGIIAIFLGGGEMAGTCLGAAFIFTLLWMAE